MGKESSSPLIPGLSPSAAYFLVFISLKLFEKNACMATIFPFFHKYESYNYRHINYTPLWHWQIIFKAIKSFWMYMNWLLLVITLITSQKYSTPHRLTWHHVPLAFLWSSSHAQAASRYIQWNDEEKTSQKGALKTTRLRISYILFMF